MAILVSLFALSSGCKNESNGIIGWDITYKPHAPQTTNGDFNNNKLTTVGHRSVNDFMTTKTIFWLQRHISNVLEPRSINA